MAAPCLAVHLAACIFVIATPSSLVCLTTMRVEPPMGPVSATLPADDTATDISLKIFKSFEVIQSAEEIPVDEHSWMLCCFSPNQHFSDEVDSPIGIYFMEGFVGKDSTDKVAAVQGSAVPWLRSSSSRLDLKYEPTKPLDCDVRIHGIWQARKRARARFLENAAKVIRSECPGGVKSCCRRFALLRNLDLSLEFAILKYDLLQSDDLIQKKLEVLFIGLGAYNSPLANDLLGTGVFETIFEVIRKYEEGLSRRDFLGVGFMDESTGSVTNSDIDWTSTIVDFTVEGSASGDYTVQGFAHKEFRVDNYINEDFTDEQARQIISFIRCLLEEVGGQEDFRQHRIFEVKGSTNTEIHGLFVDATGSTPFGSFNPEKMLQALGNSQLFTTEDISNMDVVGWLMTSLSMERSDGFMDLPAYVLNGLGSEQVDELQVVIVGFYRRYPSLQLPKNNILVHLAHFATENEKIARVLADWTVSKRGSSYYEQLVEELQEPQPVLQLAWNFLTLLSFKQLLPSASEEHTLPITHSLLVEFDAFMNEPTLPGGREGFRRIAFSLLRALEDLRHENKDLILFLKYILGRGSPVLDTLDATMIYYCKQRVYGYSHRDAFNMSSHHQVLATIYSSNEGRIVVEY